MSADYTDICPQCLADEKHEVALLETEIDQVYGALPAKVYSSLRAAFDARKKALEDEEDFRTFNENYEFWLDKDEQKLHVSYSGECYKCGYQLNLQHEQDYVLREEQE